MRGINNALILGRLGQPVTQKQTKNGKNFVDLLIATNRSVQRDGAWVEETDWHMVRFWGTQADICVKHLDKGSVVAIEGSLRTDSWTDADGNKHFHSYVSGQTLHLLPNNTPKSPYTPSLSITEPLDGLVPIAS